MKKYLRRKTDEELLKVTPWELNTVGDEALFRYTKNEWLSCGRCKVIFQTGDKIFTRIKDNHTETRCPLKRGFFKKDCGFSLSWGEPEYFEEKYIFVGESTNQ